MIPRTPVEIAAEGMRVIVCGGRDYRDQITVDVTMDRIHAKRPISTVIHGNAKGADELAGRWAYRKEIRELPVPAEWDKFGKSAGPRRNTAMLGKGAHLVVAFPGGKGTANMVAQARNAGIEVIEVAAAPHQGGKP